MPIPTALLRKANKSGLLKELFSHGLASYKALMMLPLRDKVDALMRAGMSRGQAIRHVAKEMNVHKTTIYRYL